MHSGIVNKIRYDDPGKLMKKPRGKLSQKAIYYSKEKF